MAVIRGLAVKVKEDEPQLGVALKDVGTPRKRVETPRRALSLTTTGPSEAIANLHSKTRGLVELYRELNPESLAQLSKDSQAQETFTRILSREVARLPGAELVLMVLAFREKGYRPPTRQVEYLADLAAAPFVDAIVVPPILPTDRDEYLSYAGAFLDAFSRINQVPILGYIPNFAYRDILKSVAFYLGRGVKDFVLEFNGHHAGVLYPNVQGVSRTLRRDVGEEFYLHGLNVGPGPFRRSDEGAPSKDFLALLSGIDSIGAKHIRKKMPIKIWQRLAAERDKGRRLFSRGDYGYYEPRVYARKFGDKADEGSMSAAAVCRNPQPYAVRLFNSERQALETVAVRKQLLQGSLYDYVQRKSRLKGDVVKVSTQWRRLQSQQTLNV